MNYQLVFKSIGNILRIEAVLMLFPLAVSIIYGGGDWAAFVWTIVILAAISSLSFMIKAKDKRFRTREAHVTAGLSWLLLSFFGALPFFFSGYFGGIVDCLFEAVSGFTTTGSTILSDVEALPQGIIFWRSFTHWVGGIGVLVFLLALIPSTNASSVNLLRAESTGPSPDKIVPKIRETARIMCQIYLVMTCILVLLLCIFGMPVFDSIINAFSTAGTGGFSNFNASIGAYNNVASEIIITVFMFLFGISFNLYFLLVARKFLKLIKDGEVLFYFGFVVVSIIIITVDIVGIYGNIAEALRRASFHVSSVVSTTGFATADFNLWPTLSKTVLVILMFMGSCAGSTGGGIKFIRVLLLLKAAKIEIGKIFHPGRVKSVSINGRTVSDDLVLKTSTFFFIYFAVFFVATALVSFDGMDIVSSATSVVASLSNVGPGLGVVGPVGNYSTFSDFSKIILSVCMIAGRLEFLPLLILFVPSVWKKS